MCESEKMKERAAESEETITSSGADEKLLNHHHHPQTPRRGGFRTIPFILVNESFEKVASVGLSSNMIFYLTKGYHMEAASASILLSLWSAMSNVLSLFGAFLADSHLGRFSVIVLGSLSSLLGITVLWLTSVFPQLTPPSCEHFSNHCTPQAPTTTQFAILFASLGLMSVGAGCVRPCSVAFGADQLYNRESPESDRAIQSYFNWYYVSNGVSTMLALTFIVAIQDRFGWDVGFAVADVFMFFSALMFFVGSPLYVKVEPGECLFTGFVQVVVAANRKRKLSLPPGGGGSEDCCYHVSHEAKIIVPSDNLRYLNKACIITNPEIELNPDGSSSNPWSLCTVDQVESLKSLLRITPIMSAGIMVIVAMSNSFGSLQANTMDRHIVSTIEIPPGSFGVFLIGSLTLWIAFYDRIMVSFLKKCTGRPNGLAPKLRMGIGLILTILAVSVSAVVEAKRRKTAIEQGFEDVPGAVVDMSAMWLVPQYVLLGIAEGFFAIGQLEFFYTEFPRTMSSIAVAMTSIVVAVSSLVGSALVKTVTVVTANGGSESWLASNLNRGHVDYYYWLIAFLGSLNFAYFLFCCRVYGNVKERKGKVSDDVVDGGESDYRELPSA